MNTDSFLRIIKNFDRKFPIRINFFLFGLLVVLFFNNLKSIVEKDNSYASIIWLMAKLSFIMLVITVLLSLSTTIVAWLRLIYLIKKEKNTERLFIFNKSTSNQNLILKINQSLAPLLGYTEVCFYYNNKQSTVFRLKPLRQFYTIRIEGQIDLQLPDITNYTIYKCTFYLKDMLHLLSLPVSIPLQHSFINTPYNILHKEINSLPQKTEELEIKIKELKKSQGEWLHYKKFENNDDIRRIVWKIFAKNKELVVRNPEIFNPYASRVDIFSSFHKSLPIKSEKLLQQLLNFYKNINWTIYDELSKGEFKVSYRTDQNSNYLGMDSTNVSLVVTAATWQNEILASEYTTSKIFTCIIIHSLNELLDVEEIIDSINNNTIVYFVPLSKAVKKNIGISVLRKLFFIKNESLKQTITEWADTKTIQKNERAIESILISSGKKFEIIN